MTVRMHRSLTPLGRRRLVVAAAIALGGLAGATAEHWNPWAKALSVGPGQRASVYEDGSSIEGCTPGAPCDDSNEIYWGEYDGHQDCWAEIGPTTIVRCGDGFTTTT